MKLTYRSKRRLTLEVEGRPFDVKVLEFPFREGVELQCLVKDELLRVSDRGLGIDEALRLLESEIKASIAAESSGSRR